MKKLIVSTIYIIGFSSLSLVVFAQGFGDPAAGRDDTRPRPVAQDSAPVDLTGYWVSVITEDYRFRMFTPAKFDYTGVPLSDSSRTMADNWDPERDEREGNACRAWGVGNLMRMPIRVHITWGSDSTLKIESDHGEQTRLLNFNGPVWQSGDVLTLQGDSVAQWDNRTLKVVTRNMALGYLRRNGIPYSEETVITEYFDQHQNAGENWFTVTTLIEDPLYLRGTLYLSSDFKKLEDDEQWNPTPCTSEWGPLKTMEDTDRFG